MQSWVDPAVPELAKLPTLSLYDSTTGGRTPLDEDLPAVYACGITPYDATHLGHAFTYVAVDTLVRYLAASGARPRYAQNVTDIDDPLFERAESTGVDWRALADSEIELFRGDMAALRVVPPDAWVAVSEILDPLEETVRGLERRGITYRLPNADDSEDIYLDRAADPDFATGPVFAGLDLAAEFDEHGGDSTRAGKRDPLDQQLWKGVRGDDFRPVGGKPGAWRPGWHIECALIARAELGDRVSVQAGGIDLLFPHHEMSESLARVVSHGATQVRGHMHVGLVAYEGEKMSKSLGNLVRVSELLEAGHDPAAIRLVLLAHHYRGAWEYTNDDMRLAERRLAFWRAAATAHSRETAGERDGEGTSGGAAVAESAGSSYVMRLAHALSDDLDTPAALTAVDEWAATLSDARPDGSEMAEMINAVDALLGIRLA